MWDLKKITLAISVLMLEQDSSLHIKNIKEK